MIFIVHKLSPNNRQYQAPPGERCWLLRYWVDISMVWDCEADGIYAPKLDSLHEHTRQFPWTTCKNSSGVKMKSTEKANQTSDSRTTISSTDWIIMWRIFGSENVFEIQCDEIVDGEYTGWPRNLCNSVAFLVCSASLPDSASTPLLFCLIRSKRDHGSEKSMESIGLTSRGAPVSNGM